MTSLTPEPRAGAIERATALLDAALLAHGPDALRGMRMMEMLADHMNVTSSEDARAILAEIRRRGA